MNKCFSPFLCWCSNNEGLECDFRKSETTFSNDTHLHLPFWSYHCMQSLNGKWFWRPTIKNEFWEIEICKLIEWYMPLTMLRDLSCHFYCWYLVKFIVLRIVANTCHWRCWETYRIIFTDDISSNILCCKYMPLMMLRGLTIVLQICKYNRYSNVGILYIYIYTYTSAIRLLVKHETRIHVCYGERWSQSTFPGYLCQLHKTIILYPWPCCE